MNQLYEAMIAVPVLRGQLRRMARRVKSAMRVADAYGDLFSIIKRTQPEAILDIGAHRGETVMRFVDDFPRQKIYAFEPTPDNAAKLEARVSGLSNVIVERLAVSDSCGSTTFFLNENSETNSMLDNDVDNIASFGNYTSHVGTVDVKTVTLDAWGETRGIKGSVVIKADVQGAEHRVLDGGRKFFTENVSALFSEISIANCYKGQANFWDFHRRITSEFPFVLAQIYRCLRDGQGRAISTDALWVRRDLTMAQ